MPRLHRFDPSPCAFAPPQLPLLPPAQWRSLSLRSLRELSSAYQAQHHARGRYALRAALVGAGLRAPGDLLLLPSYHCRTMVDAALELGLQLRCYPLQADLELDLAALGALLTSLRAESPVQRLALLLPHFFGHPQRGLSAVQSLCQQHGVILIEDASHVLLLSAGAPQEPALAAGLGSTADWVISSPYKFVAAPDGGLLWVRGHALPPAPRPASWRQELRAALAWARQACTRAQRPLDRPAPAEPAAAARMWLEDPATPSERYLGPEHGRASLRLSQWLMRHARPTAAAAARRRHYAELVRGVQGLQGLRPLLPTLAPDTVPYMVPLLLDDAEPHFSRLKARGLPIWRWDEMLSSACEVASAYRLRLLHLPCHEGLRDADLQWMLRTLRSEFESAGPA